jgi:hypothetical protein
LEATLLGVATEPPADAGVAGGLGCNERNIRNPALTAATRTAAIITNGK